MSYLQFVNGRYRVRIVVPPALRSIIGKESLVKSLGTGNCAKTTRLAVPYITEFTARLAEAASERCEYKGVWDRVNDSSVKLKRHSNFYDPKVASQEWFTPPKVFEAMGVEFDMDVASPGAELLPWIPAKRHLTLAQDGLKTPWEGFVWLNPPYGLRNGMRDWLDKFVAHHNGVILLPGYTYTKWWHDFIVETDCVLFPLFKLQFISRLSTGGNSAVPNCLAAIGQKGLRPFAERQKPALGDCSVWIEGLHNRTECYPLGDPSRISNKITGPRIPVNPLCEQTEEFRCWVNREWF